MDGPVEAVVFDLADTSCSCRRPGAEVLSLASAVPASNRASHSVGREVARVHTIERDLANVTWVPGSEDVLDSYEGDGDPVTRPDHRIESMRTLLAEPWA